jgi:hypothetical protein
MKVTSFQDVPAFSKTGGFRECSRNRTKAKEIFFNSASKKDLTDFVAVKKKL